MTKTRLYIYHPGLPYPIRNTICRSEHRFECSSICSLYQLTCYQALSNLTVLDLNEHVHTKTERIICEPWKEKVIFMLVIWSFSSESSYANASDYG